MLPPLSMLPIITSLWHEVLQTDAFTDDTHFFLAGGDSLQLTRVMLRLQQACGIQLQLRDAVEFSTPRKMAAWCEHLLTLTRSHDSSCSQQAQREYRCYQACSMQQGLWLAEQQAGEVALYNTAALLHLQGKLDIQVLEQALSVLLHKHPVLRTRMEFDLAKRSLQGNISPFQPVFLQAEQLTPGDLSAVARERAARRFELSKAMYCFQLFRLGDEHHALLLCCHHAITDGWSAGVMLQSLAEAYNKLHMDPSWQAREIDTAFLARCQQDSVNDRVGVEELRWWRQHLDASPACPQPKGLARARRWPFAMKSWQTKLQPDLLPAIRSICSRHHVTPFACLFTALKLALAKQARTAEQTVGFPVAARNSAAQENSIGCYVNTLLTRDVIDGPGLSAGLLRRVHGHVQDALLHALPLQQLIRQLRPAPLSSGNAWFDVLFAFQNLPARTMNFHGLRAHVQAVDALHGQYPLKLEVLPASAASAEGTCWKLRFEYAGLLFQEGEVAELAVDIRQYLSDLVTIA